MGVRNWEYHEMVRLLKYYGCELRRKHGGSHEIRYSPITNREFPVVRPHGGDKVSADGTFLGMLKFAGIEKEEAKNFKEGK